MKKHFYVLVLLGLLTCSASAKQVAKLQVNEVKGNFQLIFGNVSDTFHATGGSMSSVQAAIFIGAKGGIVKEGKTKTYPVKGTYAGEPTLRIKETVSAKQEHELGSNGFIVPIPQEIITGEVNSLVLTNETLTIFQGSDSNDSIGNITATMLIKELTATRTANLVILKGNMVLEGTSNPPARGRFTLKIGI